MMLVAMEVAINVGGLDFISMKHLARVAVIRGTKSLEEYFYDVAK